MRLLAQRSSRSLDVYTFTRPLNGSLWEIKETPEIVEGIPDPLAFGTFVLDTKTGLKLQANRSGLTRSLEPPTGSHSAGRCFVVIAGAKGVRTNLDITGERLGKADWKTKTTVKSVQVIERSGKCVEYEYQPTDHMLTFRTGSHALVAITDTHEVLIYSLPHLEFVHSMQLPVDPKE